jgi:hypothetical protein
MKTSDEVEKRYAIIRSLMAKGMKRPEVAKLLRVSLTMVTRATNPGARARRAARQAALYRAQVATPEKRAAYYEAREGQRRAYDRSSRCKELERARRRERWQRDSSDEEKLEAKRAADRAYKDANREAINARKRKHYAANAEELQAKRKARNAAKKHAAAPQKRNPAIYRGAALPYIQGDHRTRADWGLA